MEDAQLNKIKRRLGIEVDDTHEDELILDLVDDAQQAFKALTGALAVPDKFAFIITDVALRMYNRKGSEGMATESVDGYSATYVAGLFDDYMDLLATEYPHLNGSLERAGRVVVW